MTKRINKILWNGTEVPKASTQADGLDGLNLGELFIKNDPQEPGVYTRTTDGEVVSLGSADWNKIKNKPTKVSYFTNDANYATTSDLDTRIDALVNGAPAAYDTLKEIADVLANNINSIDDILTALGTKVSKDDFNTAIANVNNSISALNTELSGKIDLKLDAVTFNELFEKVQLEDGTWAIKAKLGLFSDGFISAKGSNVGGTSSEGGAVALYQLNDVLANGTQVSGAVDGAVFVYDGKQGKWKGIAQSEIVPNLTGYATESWVKAQGYLTQHQDLSAYAKKSDIPTIPTDDINKGVTAHGWGDHRKVGYLTGITSKLVTDALGYTPYDAANFTKAKIKSTLGISDWALASSKPSYTTKEVAEDTNLYFTNARAVSALKSVTDGLSGNISTLQGYFTDGVANSALRLSDNGSYTAWGQTFFTNGKPKSVSGALTDVTTITTSGAATIGGSLSNQISHLIYDSEKANRLSMAWVNGLSCIYSLNADNSGYNDLRLGVTGNTSSQLYFDASESKWGIGTSTPEYKLDVNGEARVTKLVIGDGTIEWDADNNGFKVTGGLYSTSYISAKGANTNGGSSSGGGLIESLWKVGDLGETFNKDANDTFNAYAINTIHNRVSVLEGKATNVSFTQSLTSGTQIGTITIDGASKTIYAPTIPTTDINKGVTAHGWGNHASAGYQPLITSTNKLAYSLISGTPTSLPASDVYAWAKKSALAASDVPSLDWSKITTGKPTTLSGYGITDAYSKSQVDSALDGYLPLSGGTLTSNNVALTIRRYTANPIIGFNGGAEDANERYGYLGFSGKDRPAYIDATGSVVYPIIHSGNIGSQSVASAAKLTTARSIWGQSFDGTGNISGALSDVTTITTSGAVTVGGLLNINGGALMQNAWYIRSYLSDGTTAHNIIGLNASNSLLINYGATAHNSTATIYGNKITLAAYADGASVSSMTWDGNLGVGTTSPKYKAHINGTLYASNAVTLGGTAADTANLAFSRSSYNYITFPTDGSLCLSTATSTSGIVLRVTSTAIEPMTTATKSVGTSSKRWGAIYGVDGDFSGTLHASGAATFGSTLTIVERLGVGTTSPQAKCDVNGAIYNNSYHYIYDGTSRTNRLCLSWNNDTACIYSIKADGSGYNNLRIGVTTTSSTRQLYLDFASGCWGVGTSTPQYRWDVNGVIHSNEGIFSDGYVSAKGQNTSSDMRLKNVLNDVMLNVSDIANAPSIRFAWKNGGGIDVGSSAQYWLGVLPDAVKERDGMLEMQYANIALLSAIALAKNFETHEERIVKLEKENKELRNEIKCLRYGA